jgi:hypothetical protein
MRVPFLQRLALSEVKRLLPGLVGSLLALFMTACAIPRPMYRFHANSVSRISYDPKNCVAMPDGRFKCKDVLFTVNVIEPVK